jgi:hypothetical protein
VPVIWLQVANRVSISRRYSLAPSRCRLVRFLDWLPCTVEEHPDPMGACQRRSASRDRVSSAHGLLSHVLPCVSCKRQYGCPACVFSSAPEATALRPSSWLVTAGLVLCWISMVTLSWNRYLLPPDLREVGWSNLPSSLPSLQISGGSCRSLSRRSGRRPAGLKSGRRDAGQVAGGSRRAAA